MTASTPYDEKPWLAHFEQNVPEKVAYEEVCLPDFLERSAARFPNKMALLFQGYQMTFSQLKEMVDRFATIYTAEEKGLTPVPIDDSVTTPPGFASGGGGLFSTAGDFLRFAQMLINGGELDGVRLLAPGTVKLMCSNKLSNKLLNGGYGIVYHQIKPGFGFGYDVAVFTDPAFMGSATGKGTYLWSGAYGTWFWNDPTNDIVFIGMIARAAGLPQPNIEHLSRTFVHQALIEP